MKSSDSMAPSSPKSAPEAQLHREQHLTTFSAAFSSSPSTLPEERCLVCTNGATALPRALVAALAAAGQLDRASRIEARMHAPASKPAATLLSLG